MMKPKSLFRVIFTLIAIVAAGCGGGGSSQVTENIAPIIGGVSSLSLSVRVEEGLAALQNIPAEARDVSVIGTVKALGVAKISVYLGLSSGPIEKVFDVSANSGSASITEIPAQMKVPVTVKALDSAGTVRYSGATVVDFIAGQTARAEVILKKIFDLFAYLPFKLGNKWYYSDHYEEVTSVTAQFNGMTAVEVTGYCNSGYVEHKDYFAFSGDNFLVLGSIDSPDSDDTIPDGIGPEQFMYGYRATYSPVVTLSRYVQTGYKVSSTISVLLEPYNLLGDSLGDSASEKVSQKIVSAASLGASATVSTVFSFEVLGTESVTMAGLATFPDTIRIKIGGNTFDSNKTEVINFAYGVGQIRNVESDDLANPDTLRGAVIGGVTYGDPTPGPVQGYLYWSGTPGDQQVEYGQMFKFQSFAYASSMPIIYSIVTLGGTGILGMDSSTGLIYSQTGGYNVLGATTFRLTVTDATGAFITHDFILTGIQDSTPPTWVMAPPLNVSLNEGDILNMPVAATDPSGVSISVSGFTGIYFDSSSGAVMSSASLSAGTFGIITVATDGFGNYITATTNVTVVAAAAQPPVFDTANPSSINVEYGTEPTQSFTVSDPGGLTPLTFRLNDTNYFCIDSSGIFCTLPGLAIGTYNLVVTATNTASAFANFSFTVIVADTVPPTWVTAPVDTTVELGEFLDMLVSADDLSGVAYSVSGSIEFSIDSSTGQLISGALGTAGNYTLVVKAADPHGHELTQSIVVTVSDTTSPRFDNPLLDQTFEYGSVFNVTATASDLSSPVGYSVSDTINFTIGQNGVIGVNSVLAVGSYPVTVTILDAATPNNSDTGSFMIYIEDTTKPVFTVTPVDATLDPSTPYSFTVTATDFSGVTYYLFDSGAASSEFSIDSVTGDIVSVNSTIAFGTYNLEVKAEDPHGNLEIHAFVLTVSSSDTTSPTWTIAPQTTFLYEIDGPGMEIEATDDSGGPVTYSLSDTTNFQIAQQPGMNMAYIVRQPTNTGLNTPLGVNVTAIDSVDNPTAPVLLTITLVDNTPPVWLTAPFNDTFTQGDTGWSMAVQAWDAGLPIVFGLSGTHAGSFNMSSSGIITQVGTLVSGIYNITVEAQDASVNKKQDSITINVTAPAP